MLHTTTRYTPSKQLNPGVTDPFTLGPPTNTDVQEHQMGFANIDQDYYYMAIVSVYALAVCISLLINLFFILILIFGIQSYKRPFYRIVWQLILANLFASVSNLCTTVPVTFFLTADQTNAFVATPAYKILNFFDLAGDQLIVWITLLIAANRLCVFVFPTVADRIFSGKSLNVLIALIWLLGVGITAWFAYNGCNYKFKAIPNDDGKFEYTCNNIGSKNHWNLIETALICQAILFPLLDLICYLRIFVEIARRRNGITQMKSAELDILKQAVLLFLAFECSIAVSFGSIYFATSDKSAFLVRRIVNTVELFAGIVTPLFFFVTSKEIRQCTSRINPLKMHITVSFSSKKVTQLKSISGSQPMSLVTRTSQSIR